MSSSNNIRLAVPSDTTRLARIHATALPEAFLSRLGFTYLAKRFYPKILGSNDVIVLVSEVEGTVQSFVIFALSSGKFEQWLSNFRLNEVGYIIWGCIRHPAIVLDILALIFGPKTEVVADFKNLSLQPELFSITTSPEFQSHGLGGHLVQAGLKLLTQNVSGFTSCVVKTESERGKKFYERNGFIEIGVEHRGTTRRIILARQLQDLRA